MSGPDEPEDPNRPDPEQTPAAAELVDLEAKRREKALAQTRAEALDVNRIDVAALVAEKAKAARDEHGWTWTPDAVGLPPGCPVTPLGKKGGTFYFLTPDCELLAMPAGNFGQTHIDALFAPMSGYVVAMWGAAGSKGNKIKVQYEVLRRDLMDACARRGVFDPAERLRGRGCWKDAKGGLVLHYGDKVVIDGEALPPGLHGDFVYPAGPRLAPPKGDGKADARAAARKLLEWLQCWGWQRGALDARFMLGWMMAAMMGAALDWRPQIMLTGDAGMGKSTLQALQKAVLGERLLDVADASAAGLYQTLGHDSLGVAFDEFENEDEARGAAVMRLARLASSGARLVRGGADGVPSNYQARGAFLFSAINPPAMRPAEQSRTTMLSLRPHKPGARAPVIDAREAADVGAYLAARIVAMWSFWPERLMFYRETLAAMGHSNRAQDQLGTLLAAADLALDDMQPVTDAMDWLDALAPSRIVEVAGVTPNWRRCLDHILAVQPDAWRTDTWRQVGQALVAMDEGHEHAWEDAKLRKQLALIGVAFVKDQQGLYWLGFPTRHPGLAACFGGTDWSARRGADGAWITALAQAPDNVQRRDQFRVGGVKMQGVMIRLSEAIQADKPRKIDDPDTDD